MDFTLYNGGERRALGYGRPNAPYYCHRLRQIVCWQREVSPLQYQACQRYVILVSNGSHYALSNEFTTSHTPTVKLIMHHIHRKSAMHSTIRVGPPCRVRLSCQPR